MKILGRPSDWSWILEFRTVTSFFTLGTESWYLLNTDFLWLKFCWRITDILPVFLFSNLTCYVAKNEKKPSKNPWRTVLQKICGIKSYRLLIIHSLFPSWLWDWLSYNMNHCFFSVVFNLIVHLLGFKNQNQFGILFLMCSHFFQKRTNQTWIWFCSVVKVIDLSSFLRV